MLSPRRKVVALGVPVAASLAMVTESAARSAARMVPSSISAVATPPVAISAATIVSAAISAVVTELAASVVAVVPAAMVMSPVSAGMRAAATVPDVRFVAFSAVRDVPGPAKPVVAVTVPANHPSFQRIAVVPRSSVLVVSLRKTVVAMWLPRLSAPEGTAAQVLSPRR